MGQYEHHVFVCTAGSWCPRDGDTEAIVRSLKSEVAAAGLKGRVRINRAGCLNQCGHGPMVVVYPAGRWYAAFTPDTAAEFVRNELVEGVAMSNCRYDAQPGDNKDLSRYPQDLVGSSQEHG
jgi:(2Fe-2S) ferredoxin